MSRTSSTLIARWTVAVLLLSLMSLLGVSTAAAQLDNESCLMCHEDPDLESDDGRNMGVAARSFFRSVHGELECVDCHSQDADYDDAPHFASYQKVDCAGCHDDAVMTAHQNFHHQARLAGNRHAPDCMDCHATGGDPHRLHGLDKAVAEESCRLCHTNETTAYDSGVHAARPGASTDRPGCITCHQSHGPGLPPSSGAVNTLCADCHEGAMDDVQRGGHVNLGLQDGGVLNCASCHDVHGTHKPHMSDRVAQTCTTCHEAELARFAGSVHEELLADGDMNCLSCHSTHKDEEEIGQFDGGCGNCHEDVEETYRSSVHRFGRLHGNEGAATCADCHQGHHVLAADNPEATINPVNIPATCGRCHGQETVVAGNYVRLPITLTRYEDSVHGRADKSEVHAATCTDCHGVHDLQHAQHPESTINHFQLSNTCGECHQAIAAQYQQSIHGQALALGIADAPTCNDCHDEHLIRSHDDPDANTSPEHIARDLCGNCHTDPEMASKYGITAGVVESFLDSYHGWAVGRGGLVATCTDCHTTHDIRSPLDPTSSIHPDNVTATCGQCHERSNETFARSYTHASALAARGPHDWAKIIYIVLIAGVLGGMALHNFIIARFELKRHFAARRREAYVVRWVKVERMQHLVLLTSFIGLAITGFALRSPDAWWVTIIGMGNETLRATIHRALAVIMVVASFYHLGWIIFSRRGRMNIAAMAPQASDIVQAIQNVAFHLGKRKERPEFHRYDYTHKAEYWALIWGTIVMAVTGVVLWFPDLFTTWLPAWSVRVAEVIHYYEAILAVSAIIIWHLFYVIFMPSEFPMSTIWVNGRMPAHEWKELHRAEYAEMGPGEILPGDGQEDGGNGDGKKAGEPVDEKTV
jgi:cytochrome b subunit of formate dehydrogenase